MAAVTAVYLAMPLSPPQVAIEFQGFKPEKTMVFHLTLDTNFNNQIFLEARWLQVFPSYKNISTEQTNAFCVLYLTNRGSTRIWWFSAGCQVEAMTPQGWVTNVFSSFTTDPSSVGTSSKDDFNIGVPADAIKWRVTGSFQYYKRHDLVAEYLGWLTYDLGLGARRPSTIIRYLILTPAFVFGLLPEPEKQYGEVYSEFFTNRLSAHLPPVKPQQ